MFGEEYPRRWRGYWKEGCIALGVLSVILLISLIAVSTSRNASPVEIMSQSFCYSSHVRIDLSERSDPTIFADLTKTELENTVSYLRSQAELNIVGAKDIVVESSYIYSIELLPPVKSEALYYLYNGERKPERWAKAIVFRGDLPTPAIHEYKVGPLPNPRSHMLLDYQGKRKNPVPFAYRPFTFPDVDLINMFVLPEVLKKTSTLMFESFGANFTNCGVKCLTYDIGAVSTSNSGKIVRKFWLRLGYNVEFITLHPLDFHLLVNLDGVDKNNYRIERVWYNQKLFNTLEDLVSAYNTGRVGKINRSFPNVDKSLFSTMNLRGKPFPSKPLRRPFQVEPDGKRYSIQGQHVEYLGWSFNYRMSTSNGPMLFDVRFRQEMIAYEVSLQEIAVFYSGFNPSSRFSNIVDSASMIGVQSKMLVPGADCPDHATFLPSRHYFEGSDSSVVFERSLCIFEHCTGNPLRRHHSFSKLSGSFYEGLMDDVLVLRTILTVGNYDYVFDFIFHQNGALEVKAMATGYILASPYSPNEHKFGFQIHSDLLGNIHHHMFNFKVDIDILGTSNRFETLDVSLDKTSNEEMSSVPEASVFNQLRFKRHLRKTEKEGIYKYSFDTPKYLLFYNEKEKTAQSLPKAYRLAIQGMSKQLLPEGKGHEPSISWARYQLAVTKFNQSELQSSSLYAIWDSFDPVNNFQSFLDNDENIVDKDLVAWVSMGVHHIPHTEDLPVTPTVGGHLQFFLLPYNYFQEDPSISSRNAVRIDMSGKDPDTGKPAIRLNHYGVNNTHKCIPVTFNFEQYIKENQEKMFE